LSYSRPSPSLNGAHAAPPQPGGVFTVAATRTVFPIDVIRLTWVTLLYGLARGQIGGIRLIRWPQVLLLLAAALWATGALPGGRGVATLWLLVWLTLILALRMLRRRDFVQFVAGVLPPVQAETLPSSAKLPVFVTGLFSVENKQQRFTWLPGFYRTFATREHALICQVAGRPAASLGRWGEDETGLWYIFFTPALIESVQWGTVTFGANRRPALVVQYRRGAPDQTGARSAPSDLETVYLAVYDQATGQRMLADLLHDWPSSNTQTPSTRERHFPPSTSSS
jgi:hypothetical protein